MNSIFTIYRPAYGDCSLGGISSKRTDLRIAHCIEDADDRCDGYIISREEFNDLIIVPMDYSEGRFAFGGNVAESDDQRKHPGFIKIHDRDLMLEV